MTDDIEQLNERALAHLQGFLEAAHFDATAALESRQDENFTYAITGPDAHFLVGAHGQTLDALQHLLLLMTKHSRDLRVRITVDADGYRARRTQTLIRFANELAAQVTESGEEAVTDPLNPMERRIIHTALVDNADVATYSEGDEPNRYVVVSPRPSASAT